MNEITVKVNCSYDKLHNDLVKQNFKIVEEYTMVDTYMIEDIDISNMKDLDILSKCILVRDIPNNKMLVFKKKLYDENENIISQSKISCGIDDINNAIKFMESINYRVLFELKDKIIVYSNKEFEMAVQIVNDKHLFIEMEDSSESGKSFNSIEEMIDEFSKLDIDYDKRNYFAKKAQIVLNESGCK